MSTQPIPPTALNTLVSIQPVTISVNTKDITASLLQNVAVGAILEGYVVNRDAQQNPILRTSLGDVLVKSELFLKTGSEVVIRVDATVESRARILTIDGISPQDYVARKTITPESDVVLNSSLLPRSQALPEQNNPAIKLTPIILPAAFVSPNVAIPDNLSPEITQYLTQLVASLQKDVNVAIKILATQLPLPDETPAAPGQTSQPQTAANVAATPIQSSTAIPPIEIEIEIQTILSQPAVIASAQTVALSQELNARAALSPQSAAKNSANTPIAPPITPTISTTFSTHVQTAIPAPLANVPTSTTIPSPSATSQKISDIAEPVPVKTISAVTPLIPAITAQVIGHELDGASIIQSPAGTFKLLTEQPIPTGTTLTIEFTSQTALHKPTVFAPLLPTDLEDLTDLVRDWHSVREAITTIARQDITLANHLIENILPKPRTTLTNELLFLFSAIKNGNPEQWLGKRAIEILDSSSPEILKRLTREFGQLQQMFSDATPQWMSVIIPFYSDAQIQQIRMFFKHEDEKEKKSSQGGGQRFLIEVNLSHLGELQFDGFIKKVDAAKHFDLVIRSARHLPQEVTQHIQIIFKNALLTTGYKGYMHFQQGSQHFVRPMEAIKEALHGDKNTILV